MAKRTSVNLDLSLVEEAGRVLGTRQTTETLHRALEEIVQRARRRQLANHAFRGLTLETLERVRRPRFDQQV